MKTLEELKAEMAEIQKQIQQHAKKYYYVGAYGITPMELDVTDNHIDKTMFFSVEDWTREEVERIALACKLLRKTYIYAKENGMNGTNYYGFPRLSGDHLGLFETEAHDDITKMQELSRKIERPSND